MRARPLLLLLAAATLAGCGAGDPSVAATPSSGSDDHGTTAAVEGCDPTALARVPVVTEPGVRVTPVTITTTPGGLPVDVVHDVVDTGDQAGERITAVLRERAEVLLASWDEDGHPIVGDVATYEGSLRAHIEVVDVGTRVVSVVLDGHRLYPGAASDQGLRSTWLFARASGAVLDRSDLGLGPTCTHALTPVVDAALAADDLPVTSQGKLDGLSLGESGVTFHWFEHDIGAGHLGNIEVTVPYEDVLVATGVDLRPR